MKTTEERLAELDRKIFELGHTLDRLSSRIDTLLDYLNLDVQYDTRWWVTKKRRYFK